MSYLTMGLLLLALALAVLAWRATYWYQEGRKLLQDGYLPPNPTFVGQLTLKVISWVSCFKFVGPVKVMNVQNARYAGRLNILPNHQFELDFMVMGKALPYGFRHLGAKNQMDTPLKSSLAAFAGFFAVNTDGGKAQSGGNAVVQMLGRVLAKHTRARLLMFPQGKLVRDNELREDDFRTGAVRALISARDEENIPEEELAILPAYIKYLRDPKYRNWYHKLMNALGRKRFRSFRMHGVTTKNCGAVVNFGKVIKLSELDPDPGKAIEQIRLAIAELQAEVEAKYQ